ncbi:unnamed protein product [Bursaphelenchus okinawaensis]|uniref:Homeobox domain-containing protein n=1 Tax=Bursaphelenchus okinawaensis TaxID=465554 RepID=A0A811JSW9_9BILA|nr:unnamed protein product [Bursaphelenchus okinawaensis]CAG9081021.1 unnamed protein product [Bursaphelenchus okinawaensis]
MGSDDATEKMRAFQQQLQALAAGQAAPSEEKPPFMDENMLSAMQEILNNTGVMNQLLPTSPAPSPSQHPLAPAAANPNNPAFRALFAAHNAQAAGFPFGIYPNLELTEAMRHNAFAAPFPFNSYHMMDPNRRKNATREATKPLKEWLNQHRTNPYPNKGDKMILTMLTGMTMTQVSTWFANARRRLKKEGKQSWSPRNGRPDDEDGTDNNDSSFAHEPHSPSGSVNSDESKQDTSANSLDDKKENGQDTPKRKIWSITDTLGPSQPSTTNSSPDDRKSIRTASPPSSSSSSDANPPQLSSQSTAQPAAFNGLPFFNPAQMNPQLMAMSQMNPQLMAMFAQMQQQAQMRQMHPMQSFLAAQQLSQMGRMATNPPSPSKMMNPMQLIQNMMQQPQPSSSDVREPKEEKPSEARCSSESSAEPEAVSPFNDCLKQEPDEKPVTGAPELPV